jgi:aminopeptidase-like protein
MSKVLEKIFDQLFHINRSITGPGYEKSLEIIKKIIPLKIDSFKTGKKVFDWTIPKVWKAKHAYIKNEKNEEIINFKKNNLHLMSYSDSVNKIMDLHKLKKNLHTNKKIPNAIPYVTSYYKKNWGMSMSYKQFKKLKKGKYKIFIDTKFYNGNLKTGNFLKKGKSKKEIIFSSYLCHPSMANNELSGPITMCHLYKKIKNINFKHSIRFLINPENIGATAFISKYKNKIKSNTIGGCVLTCCGNNSFPIYKKSKKFSLIDLAFSKALKLQKHKIQKYYPTGSDECRYNSPGINVPFGAFMRAVPGEHKEYHSSLDNKKFINFKNIEKNVEILIKVIKIIDKANVYKNLNPNCEPFLQKKNLVRAISDYTPSKKIDKTLQAIFWIMNYTDGYISDLEIEYLSGIDKKNYYLAIDILIKKKLIKKIN